ncbi:serine hydrolase domain-containing protein [Glycomyces buryatensis]|nr:serine hydrolase domain-containing protein [Glycomyces buryatensis]
MRTIATAALTAALIVTSAAPAAAEPAPADLDAYIEASLERNGVPGAAWAVVSADGVEHTAAHGTDGNGDPVTETSPFLWGSVAKPVTATTVMTLVEDGRIDLDEPAATYLPDFTLADSGRSGRITVRHLLEQTSGIPEGTGITDRFDAAEDPYGQAVADLAVAETFAEPGTEFEYASANYLVLGAIVQAVSGMPYEDYLREAVLEPTGMNGAIATAEAAQAVPDGHAYVFGQATAIDAPFDPTGPSYGYLGGTVDDLARFAMMQLGKGAIGETRVLEPESVELAQTPAAAMNERVGYGLGWKIGDGNADLGTTTVFHTGGAPGYSAAIVLLPELDRAVVIAQNAYGYFQDGALIGPVFGAARIVAGGAAELPEGDGLYVWALAIVLSLLAAAALVTVWTLVRLRRAPKRIVPAWRVWIGMGCWAVGGLALAYAMGVALPGLAPSRVLFTLMMPDVAWSATALAIAALAVVAAKLWAGSVRLRRGARAPESAGG